MRRRLDLPAVLALTGSALCWARAGGYPRPPIRKRS
jgi:hypothetical protein